MKTDIFRVIKVLVLIAIIFYTVIFMDIKIVTTTIMLILFSIINSVIFSKRVSLDTELFLLQANTLFFFK